MFSFLRKIVQKAEVTDISHAESVNSPMQKLPQEATIEHGTSLGPRRKYECIHIGNQIGDILNQQTQLDRKVSEAVNLIYHSLNFDYVLLWIVENDSKVLLASVGKNIDMLPVEREKQSRDTLVDRVIQGKKHEIVRDQTPN